MIHELKTWPEGFEEVLSGVKTHEVRVLDRPFMVGDVLHLREYRPAIKSYTGRSLEVEVTYITEEGRFGLPIGICVMSIRKVLETRKAA